MGGSDGCRTRVLELQGSRSKRRARQKVEPLRILLPVTTGNGERVTVEWPSVGAEWLPMDKKHRGAWCCGKLWHQVVSSKWVVNSGVLARCTDAWIPSLRPPLHARIGHPTPPPPRHLSSIPWCHRAVPSGANRPPQTRSHAQPPPAHPSCQRRRQRTHQPTTARCVNRPAPATRARQPSHLHPHKPAACALAGWRMPPAPSHQE